jgi:hypothetical protein
MVAYHLESVCRKNGAYLEGIGQGNTVDAGEKKLSLDIFMGVARSSASLELCGREPVLSGQRIADSRTKTPQ